MSRGPFSDDEMAQIVGRAAAMQDDPDDPGGHSLREIQDVAGQIGIPADQDSAASPAEAEPLAA